MRGRPGVALAVAGVRRLPPVHWELTAAGAAALSQKCGCDGLPGTAVSEGLSKGRRPAPAEIAILVISNSLHGGPMAHQQFAACIAACNDCADACDHCAIACLGEADPKPMARCIALDVDCTAICRLASGYMARGSEWASTLCAACADVCEACGAECGKHDMEHCRKCAQACRRCAEECRRMASPAAARTQSQGQSAVR
jgi:hypothetical protein